MHEALETESRRLDTEPVSEDWLDHDAPLAECHGAIPAFDQFAPAEACTELGAGTSAPRLSWWRRILIACLRRRLEHLASEREHYLSLGWVGPAYLINSYAQQRELMTRIRKLGGEAQP